MIARGSIFLLVRNAFALCFPCLLSLGFAYAQGALPKRFALVIGNSNYQSLPVLGNPTKDSAAVAGLLRQLHFTVVYKEDAKLGDMDQLADQLDQQGAGADILLFYYAGHGLQVDGENFLAPVDAQLRISGEVRYKTVALGVFLEHMEHARARGMIAIIDACRDNPLPPEERAVAAGAGLNAVTADRG